MYVARSSRSPLVADVANRRSVGSEGVSEDARRLEVVAEGKKSIMGRIHLAAGGLIAAGLGEA